MENFIDAIRFINAEGFDNSRWCVETSVFSTRAHFGTRYDLRLDGSWLFLYVKPSEHRVMAAVCNMSPRLSLCMNDNDEILFGWELTEDADVNYES